MSSITRWVLAHKRIVVAFWLVLTAAGIAAAGPASNALKQEFSVPGKEGWTTNQAIARRYAALNLGTRYYNPEIHRAAFALPNFVQTLTR